MSTIKVDKITGRTGSAGASSPLQFSGDVLTTVTITNATIASATITEMGSDLLPTTDDTYDLGSTAKRWQNIYTTDLHLVNERGNWTVIEEENYLTLRNNKTNKVFKLVMEEIE